MDGKTLKALKGSIKKWEKIVKGTGVDEGDKNCPLCKLFFLKKCLGCLIFEKTGRFGCIKTPYNDWVNHHILKHENKLKKMKVYCDTCKELAQKELDFLKSLSKKEIELCREIARYHKKEINKGDYFISGLSGEVLLNTGMLVDTEYKKPDVPIWTWEDAREWLIERGWRLNQHYDGWSCRGGRVPQKPDMVGLEFWSYENVLLPAFNGRGKTDLETILKVVLAVLKREKQ